MIFDWDIHHGDGTENIFYDSPDVLYISIHRYDNGVFFPKTGNVNRVGKGPGEGFNINIGFDSQEESGEIQFRGNIIFFFKCI